MSFGMLSNLEYLNLSYNPLEELPQNLENLKSLKGLYLTGTSLTYLPSWIASLSKLSELDIGETKITELPSTVKMLKNLKVIEWKFSILTDDIKKKIELDYPDLRIKF